ncbi:MAG: Nif3-like dinuclear metal center hexameric protein [Planctomycetaceae bacterium]|nr:Nif3-like dinuclear metal center hexameric protein [Planctomycetaceae bacterium]
MLLRDLIPHLESLAPPQLAESWDNTGLLLGDRAAEVQRVLTCLTLTPDVAAEAVELGAHLVVTHHPLMFKPVQRLTGDTGEGRTLMLLARHGIAVYSPHTSWDNAPQGINQQLAELLELTDVVPLRPKPAGAGCKLVTFVPQSDLENVQRALWQAGCGVIGNYANCSFISPGTGTFFGMSGAEPAMGRAGQLEQVSEQKLEVVCPKTRLAAALSALREAHPYEEPAVDVIPLEPLPDGSGAGRAGRLGAPATLAAVAERVRRILPGPGLQFVGDPDRIVERVGVACGAAADFWHDARRAGCQVLLTGETRFHTALEVREAGFSMIVAGHFATERFAMVRLANLLGTRCLDLHCAASTVERDPLASC